MRLTVLGCTGSYPGPEGACSGYLLRAGDEVVMVDAGPGTVSALQHHVELGELTAVVLTHHHPDHWTDLAVLRTAWKWGLGRDDLPVFGTAENRAIADVVTDGLAPTMRWTDLAAGDEVCIGGLSVRCSRTDHYVPALALHFRYGDSTLLYTGDTGPGWSPAAFGVATRTGLFEATLLHADLEGEGERVLHLTAREAGELARDAGVDRLLLTHLPSGADPEEHRAEAAAAFGGPVEVVRQHATYDC